MESSSQALPSKAFIPTPSTPTAADGITRLDNIITEFGMVASYEYQSMVFYDTKDVFDRHNFARQLKRNLLEEDYVIEKNKYYLSKIGIVTYAVKTGHSKFIDAMMNILESPAADEFSHPPS